MTSFVCSDGNCYRPRRLHKNRTSDTLETVCKGLGVRKWEDEKIDDLLSIISDVSTRVHREVDLVDLRIANDVLRREVLAEGQTLYVSQPDRVLEWEGTAISRYQRYREEVSDLLKDFQSTGVGYSQRPTSAHRK